MEISSFREIRAIPVGPAQPFVGVAHNRGQQGASLCRDHRTTRFKPHSFLKPCPARSLRLGGGPLLPPVSGRGGARAADAPATETFTFLCVNDPAFCSTGVVPFFFEQMVRQIRRRTRSRDFVPGPAWADLGEHGTNEHIVLNAGFCSRLLEVDARDLLENPIL